MSSRDEAFKIHVLNKPDATLEEMQAELKSMLEDVKYDLAEKKSRERINYALERANLVFDEEDVKLIDFTSETIVENVGYVDLEILELLYDRDPILRERKSRYWDGRDCFEVLDFDKIYELFQKYSYEKFAGFLGSLGFKTDPIFGRSDVVVEINRRNIDAINIKSILAGGWVFKIDSKDTLEALEIKVVHEMSELKRAVDFGVESDFTPPEFVVPRDADLSPYSAFVACFGEFVANAK